MTYQGLRISREGQYYVRYRHKGEIVERGPYATAAEALAREAKSIKAAREQRAS